MEVILDLTLLPIKLIWQFIYLSISFPRCHKFSKKKLRGSDPYNFLQYNLISCRLCYLGFVGNKVLKLNFWKWILSNVQGSLYNGRTLFRLPLPEAEILFNISSTAVTLVNIILFISAYVVYIVKVGPSLNRELADKSVKASIMETIRSDMGWTLFQIASHRWDIMKEDIWTSNVF